MYSLGILKVYKNVCICIFGSIVHWSSYRPWTHLLNLFN